MPVERLLEYSASADVGIIPYPSIDLNTCYCTPNKLFEFIQAGIPIIANSLPELNRFVRDQEIGITRKMETPADIAFAIDDYFSLDTGRFRSNSAGIRKSFTWKAQEPRIREIFSPLLKNSQ